MDEARHDAPGARARERGWGRVSPNPMVGAVVVATATDRRRGLARGPGHPHAEVMALAAAGDLAAAPPSSARSSRATTSAAPRPCTRALIEAGVARVVVATTRPNLGDGRPASRAPRGRHRGRDGRPGRRGRRLNAAFERHVTTGLPFVTLKMAASPRRQDGGERRVVAVDHGRGGAGRRAAPAAGADAIVVGSRHGARRRPRAHRPRSAFAGRGRRSASSSTRAGRVPATGRAVRRLGPHPRRDHRLAPRSARARVDATPAPRCWCSSATPPVASRSRP